MLRTFLYLFFAAATSPIAWCQFKIQAVVNSASFQSGMPRGGGIASILITGVAGTAGLNYTPGLITAPSALPPPQMLGGFQVTVNGGIAPILAVYVAPDGQTGQINIQVPLERNATLPGVTDAGGTLSVFRQFQGGILDTLAPLPLPAWGGFFADANGYAIAVHAADHSLVTVQNPAHPAETVYAYADGFFTVWPPPPIALPAPQIPLILLNGTPPLRYGLYLQSYPPPGTTGICGGCLGPGSITNTPAIPVLLEALAPNMIGVELISLIVPANQQPGDWALFFNSGSCTDGTGQACGIAVGTMTPTFGMSSPFVKLPVR